MNLKRPPHQLYVHLRTKGPKLQNWVDFVEACCLLLFSFKPPPPQRLLRGPYYPRTPPNNFVIDHEYRRVSRSALAFKLEWSIKAVVDVLHKDIDCNMGCQATRAVHLRLNMIKSASIDMLQADV